MKSAITASTATPAPAIMMIGGGAEEVMKELAARQLGL
jgi:hypothetical protein